MPDDNTSKIVYGVLAIIIAALLGVIIWLVVTRNNEETRTPAPPGTTPSDDSGGAGNDAGTDMMSNTDPPVDDVIDNTAPSNWSDDFKGSALDTKLWTLEESSWLPGSVEFVAGDKVMGFGSGLILTSVREPGPSGKPWKSAKLVGLTGFKAGTLTVVCRVPKYGNGNICLLPKADAPTNGTKAPEYKTGLVVAVGPKNGTQVVRTVYSTNPVNGLRLVGLPAFKPHVLGTNTTRKYVIKIRFDQQFLEVSVDGTVILAQKCTSPCLSGADMVPALFLDLESGSIPGDLNSVVWTVDSVQVEASAPSDKILSGNAVGGVLVAAPYARRGSRGRSRTKLKRKSVGRASRSGSRTRTRKSRPALAGRKSVKSRKATKSRTKNRRSKR